MALTKEQDKFKSEVEAFLIEARKAMREATEIRDRAKKLIKQCDKTEREIREMARERGIIQ